MTAGSMPNLTRAACRTAEGERLFFYNNGRNVAACKAICGTCPDKADCLRWGLLHEAQWGIWGGHTVQELDRLRTQYGIEVDVLRADFRATPSTRPLREPRPSRRSWAAANTARLAPAPAQVADLTPEPQPQPEPAPAPAPIELSTSPKVRKWALRDGWQLPKGRRLPGAVVLAYCNAHPGETR